MSDSTVDAIQAINRSVGLNAITPMPTTVESSMFPAAVVILGPMDGGKLGTTTYVTLVMLASTSQGIDPQTIFDTGSRLIKALRDAYAPLGQVNGYAIDKGSHATRRHGFGSPFGLTDTIKYAGGTFYGFTWSTPIVEWN